MTDLLARALPGQADPTERPPVILAAAGAALWVAVIGLAAVTLVAVGGWATASATADAPSALRAAGALWLLAHHAGIGLGSGTFALVPLGLTALPAALLHRAGRSLARQLEPSSWRAAWTVSGALAASYALTCVAVALAIRAPGLRPHAVQALLGGWVLALGCGGAGVLRQMGRGNHAGLLRGLVARAPAWLPSILTAAAVAAAAVVAVAAVLAGASLGAHHARAAALTAALDPGGVGIVALLLLQVAYLPDTVVWGVGYVVGPGFSVGAGSAYAAAGYAGGPVPALPLLAALPDGPLPAWARALLLAVPVLAGAAAGWLVHRRRPPVAPSAPGASAWELAGHGLAAGAVAALLLAVVVAVAGGPAGPGAMATVGASAWRVGLLAAAELAPTAALVAGLAGWLDGRRPR
ncbi:MAG: DUF6350 family protein [Frankiaceae bacterium]